MLDIIKALLGENTFTDSQITMAAKVARAEVCAYCNVTKLDQQLELEAAKIAILNLNRLGSEGLASQGFSGVSESYINNWPEDIIKVLNRKRKIKVI